MKHVPLGEVCMAIVFLLILFLALPVLFGLAVGW